MALELDLRWRPVDGVGLEHCHVRETADGIRIRSALIGEREGLEFGLSYDIELAPDWTFRSVFIDRADGPTLDLAIENGVWLIDGERADELAGCVDIDISGTPLTNTLPIRRVPLAVGQPQRFTMAWIPLDTLEPFANDQIYTRLDETRFRYQSADGSFEQVLTVDKHGFVVDYPTLFARA